MFSVSRGRLAVSFYCLLAVLFLSCSLAFAQKITGDISGSITDSSGAVVPNVTITAQHTGTGVTRTTTTSSSGNYTLPELPIGTYKVTAKAQGFKTLVQQTEVVAGGVTHADFKLPVGQLTETIEVQGAAPLVDLSPNNNNYVDSQRSKTFR